MKLPLQKHDLQFIANTFLSSGRFELGIFWLSEDGSSIIHSKTVLEEDINSNASKQYSFLHKDEWHNHPKEYDKSYTYYPRGRIEYNRGTYTVELTGILLDESIKTIIRNYFNLPLDTGFIVGLWKHQ